MVYNVLDGSARILSPVGYIEFPHAVKKDEDSTSARKCGPPHCDFKPWQRLQQFWFARDCPFSVF